MTTKVIRITYHTPSWHAVLGYRLDGYWRSVLHPDAGVDGAKSSFAQNLGDNFALLVHRLVHPIQPLPLQYAPSTTASARATPPASTVMGKVWAWLGGGGQGGDVDMVVMVKQSRGAGGGVTHGGAESPVVVVGVDQVGGGGCGGGAGGGRVVAGVGMLLLLLLRLLLWVLLPRHC